MARPPRPPWRAPLLGGLFLAALALRLWGIGFGMPLTSNYYVRPDESLVVEMALRSGEDPRFYFYPALMPVICGVLFRLVHFWAAAFSSAPPGFTAHAASDLGFFFLIARTVSAVAGAALSPVAYLAASRLSSPRAGVIAAALVAVSPLAVREAHFGVTDTLLALAVAAVFTLLADPPSRDRGPWLLATGAGLGLAVAAKYPGAFLAPAVAVSVLSTGPPGRRLRDLARVLGIAAAVFLAVNPYLPFHLEEARETVRVLTRAIYQRQASPGGWSIAAGVANIAVPLRWGPALLLGPLLAALGLLVVLAVRPRRGLGVVGLVGAAGFGLPLFLGHVVPYRYVLPLVPLVAIWAGVALDRPFAGGLIRPWRVASLAGTSALVAASLASSVRLDLLLARPDTRSLAGAWIRLHVPAACPILVVGGPETEPQLVESVASLGRRTSYVERRYGPKAGEVVSRLYRLEAQVRRSTPDAGRGHEVYRGEAPPAGSGCLCVVSGSYPGFPGAPAIGGRPGRETDRARFSPVEGPGAWPPLDPADGFFLPMSGLFRLDGPGPLLEVEVRSEP